MNLRFSLLASLFILIFLEFSSCGECEDEGGKVFKSRCYKDLGTTRSRYSCYEDCFTWRDEGRCVTFTSLEEYEFLVDEILPTTSIWLGMFVNDKLICTSGCPPCLSGDSAWISLNDFRDPEYAVGWNSTYPFTYACSGGELLYLLYVTSKTYKIQSTSSHLTNLRCVCVVPYTDFAGTCFGLPSTDEKVCGGHGICYGSDVCDCSNGFFGDDCTLKAYGCESSSLFDEETGVCIERSSDGNHYEPQDEAMFYGAWYKCSQRNINGKLATYANSAEFQAVSNKYASKGETYIGAWRIGWDKCPPLSEFEWIDGTDTQWLNSYSNWDNCYDASEWVVYHDFNDGDVFRMFSPWLANGRKYLCQSYVPSCNGRRLPQKAGCYYNGWCINDDLCYCESNHFDTFCNLTTCDGTWNNESSVCSSRGDCVRYDQCQCLEGYYGQICEVTECYNYLSNDSFQCNGNGDCVDYEKCECYDEFYGEKCTVFDCRGYLSNDTRRCSGHGLCLDFEVNTCSCEEEEYYFGEECNITKCFGVLSNDSDVCSHHGSCSIYNQCACDEDYFGLFCNVTSCLGILSNDTLNVCSGKGVCELESRTCVCEEGYFGEDGVCNVTTCGGMFSNETDSRLYFCHNHGECWPENTCICEDQYFGSRCNVTTCDETFSNDTIHVCSNHGVCTHYENCDCEEGYYGRICDVTRCYGFLSNESSQVCSGHGKCDIVHQNCSCDPPDYYTEYKCQNFSCYNISKHEVDDVRLCSSHGDCIDHDFCQCYENYTGHSCNLFTCFGVFNNQTEENGVDDVWKRVCSGHGDCVDHDNCSCTEYPIAYPGYMCHEWSCDGKAHTSNQVCNGNGLCYDWNECLCFPGYYDRENYCYDFNCGGLHFSEDKVCYGRGKCIAPDKCQCTGNYEGEDCETWSCGSVDQLNPLVCNGHGICRKPEKCQCTGSYSGKLCRTNVGLAIGLGIGLPIFATISTVLIGMFVLGLILLLLCVFCVFVCVFLCCIVGLSIFLVNQKQRLKRYNQLKNFDLLLKEQQIEEEEGLNSGAKIKINKSLFEIDYNDVKIESVLGEGGSDSVVYKASWKNQTVAFKCFKTRAICKDQSSYEEFEKEVSILSSIAHPNIVRFYGCTLKLPRLGILMEFCENGDLVEFLFVKYPRSNPENTSYPWESRLVILKEVCMSMEYLHSRNIIHRDLKLENVLLDSQRHCKLMDFGLSKLVDRMSQAKTQRIGTSVYIAPEVILESTYNEKCDVFGFAMMMYIILTLNLSPYGRDETCVELKVAQDPNFRPDLNEISKTLEKEKCDVKEIEMLKKVIHFCWNHDPSKRMPFKSIGQFLIKGDESRPYDEEIFKEDIVVGTSTPEDDQRKQGGEIERKEQLIQRLYSENQELCTKLEEMEGFRDEVEKLRIENKFLKKKVVFQKKQIDDLM